MITTPQPDRLAAPYALGVTGSDAADHQPVLAHRLADVIDGPHLQGLLADRFDLATDAAEQAATLIGAALHVTWRAASYGEDYQTWVGRMSEALLKCLVEMAARAGHDEFAVGHELRMARLMLTELAVEIGCR